MQEIDYKHMTDADGNHRNCAHHALGMYIAWSDSEHPRAHTFNPLVMQDGVEVETVIRAAIERLAHLASVAGVKHESIAIRLLETSLIFLPIAFDEQAAQSTPDPQPDEDASK